MGHPLALLEVGDAMAAATVGQLAPPGGNSIFAEIPSLPNGPLWERWLLETPWTLAVMLVLAGVVAIWAMSRAGKTRMGVIGLAAGVALAGGVVLLARSVTTERERLVGLTERLYEAVREGDAPAVDRALSENVTLELLGKASARDKRYIVEQVRSGVAKRYSTSSRLAWAKATIDGPSVARSQFKVMVESNQFGDTPTQWVLHWRRDTSGAWIVNAIEAQQIGVLQSVGDI